MVNVIKATGEVEPYSEEKVLRSVQRAGIPKELQSSVLAHIKEKLHDNMETWEIYHHISEFLGKSQFPYSKSRYSLKQAIMMLGPTGYPFEDYVAKILQAKGYSTEVRQVLQGTCVTHEVDVVIRPNNKTGSTAMVEAKFHNSPGARSDVHVSLYTKARFDDLKDRYRFDEAWLVTNTKATIDAVTYAQCIGMKVISWSYPEQESLRDLIETSGLYPITMLTNLSSADKFKLLQNHIVLCRDICSNHALLDSLRLPPDVRKRTLEEISFICEANR
ncbi:MAG: restriction endonuclease [Candidatus Levybacteria bacterium]|nr:restriction endonuclease [Candidatus Levybacteria bacterium]